MSGRTKGSDLPLGREHLSPHRHPRPRLLGRGPPRSRRYAHAPTCPAHPCRLGHARALTSTLAVNHVFALTHTVEVGRRSLQRRGIVSHFADTSFQLL